MHFTHIFCYFQTTLLHIAHWYNASKALHNILVLQKEMPLVYSPKQSCSIYLCLMLIQTVKCLKKTTQTPDVFKHIVHICTVHNELEHWQSNQCADPTPAAGTNDNDVTVQAY